MAARRKTGQAEIVCAVVQNGRLGYEAVLFAASFRSANPDYAGRLVFLEPQPGPLWPADPRLKDSEIRAFLAEQGAEFLPFESRHFGAAYPYGNKIEGLAALPAGVPFVFFDTDTLHLGPLSRVPFDFARPGASERVENTWPQTELYGPSLHQIWGALYARFGLDFEAAQDGAWPRDYWRRYPYFNAGWFFFEDGPRFGAKFLEVALALRDGDIPEMVCQSLDPWLDQAALPLVLASFGGGRGVLPAGLLDGAITCHWRALPLLYAREADRVVRVLEEITAPNRVKKILKGYEPFKRMVYQGRGARVRAMFDRDALPRREAMIRNQVRKAGLWMR